MIGYVQKRHDDGQQARAILHEDGGWSFEGDPDPAARLQFAVKCLDLPDEGPADGPFGPGRLHALAALVHDEPHVEHKQAAPPGTVY